MNAETFLELEHPEVLAARKTPHEPVPMPLSDDEKAAGHICRGRCVCDRCWLFFSEKPHPRGRRRASA